MRNGVQLIAYADRLGNGNLSTLRDLLTGPLEGVFTGVHILPFFTPFDGADAGFDPTDHTTVDPRLGDWTAVRDIGATHEVTADLIVNHISVESPQFQDFLAKGSESRYAGMFLEVRDVFPDGVGAEELAAIYRPRPTSPFTDITMADGSKRQMWTTFTADQIDLDTTCPLTIDYLLQILDLLTDAAVKQVRLDAVGYAVKTPGTSCFMTGETLEFIGGLCTQIAKRGMNSLLEIHSHFEDQIEAAAVTDRVYDFALSPLVLHSLQTGSSLALRRWLRRSPRNAITVLDTHDGIGVIDVGPRGDRQGLLSEVEIDNLVEGIHQASGGESRLATGAAASNLDLYQVNCTYLSALGDDQNLHLLARLIQFLSPGIPQVYYAGLLAATNDMALLSRTGVGRDINRPYFDLDGIRRRLQMPGVKRLMALARFRNRNRAFDGEFSVEDGQDHELIFRWQRDGSYVRARIDLAAQTFVVETDHGTITDWDAF